MVLIFYILFFLLILLISFNKFKSIVNFISIFTFIWFFWGVVSLFGFFDLRIPSATVHCMVMTFVVIFDFVFLFFSSASKRVALIDNPAIGSVYLKRAYIAQILSLVLIVPYLLAVFPRISLSNGLVALRLAYFSGDIFPTMYQSLFFRTIPKSMWEAQIFFYVYFAVTYKCPKAFLFAILNALFSVAITGGRYDLIGLMYGVFLMIVVTNQDVDIFGLNKIIKNKVKKIIIVLLCALLLVTLMRNQILGRGAVTYFAGSLSFLDFIIANPHQFALNEYSYGYLTFGAFIEPVVLLLKVLNFTTIKVPSYDFNIFCQKFYDISASQSGLDFNANTTILYYFLRDFGTLGIVIGAFFVGFLCVLLYNKWQKGSDFFGILFIAFAIVMMNSVMTFQFFGPSPFFIVLTLFFITRSRNNG